MFGNNAKKQPKAKKPVEMKFNLSPESADRLNALVATTEASGPGDVVKEALRLYEAMIQYAESGHTFKKVTKDGKESSMELFAT